METTTMYDKKPSYEQDAYPSFDGNHPLFVAGMDIPGNAAEFLPVLFSAFRPEPVNIALLLLLPPRSDGRAIQALLHSLPIPFRVCIASHSARIEPGTIWLLPAGKRIQLLDHGLPLETGTDASGKGTAPGPAFNALLKTLALRYGSRAIGIKLTHSRRDTEGIRAIQHSGGLILRLATRTMTAQKKGSDGAPGTDLRVTLREIPGAIETFMQGSAAGEPPATRMTADNEANLNAIVENFDGYVWSMDRDFRYVLLNSALRRKIREWTGADARPGDKVLDLLEILDPSKTSDWQHIYREGFKGKSQRLVYEFRIEGKEAFYEFSLNPIRKDDRVTGLSCFARDVTEETLTERKLKASEIGFRALIENSTDIIVLIDAQGRIVYGSPSIENLFGVSSSEYLSASAFEYLHPDDILPLSEKFMEVLQNPETPIRIQGRAHSKDGRQIWVEGIVNNLLHKEGINGIVCNFRDVTERIEAEEALQQRELKFRSLIENSADLIMMANGEGNFIYGSPSLKRYLGYADEDYLNKSVFTFVHPESIPNAQHLLGNLMENPGKPFMIYLKLIHKNGSDRWVEGLATNLFHVDGVNALVANFRDVSERIKADQLLRESEDRYKNLFNKSPLPVYVCDTGSCHFLEVNDAAVHQYGYTRNQFLKMNIFQLVPPQEHAELKKMLAGGNGNPRAQTPRMHVRKNNEVIFVEVFSHVISFKGNDAYLIIVNDVTEKIRLQQQLMEEKIHRQREVTKATIDAQEKEREEIGRELHDNVNQILSTAQLCLSCADEEEHLMTVMVERSRSIISTAIEEIRKLSKTLVQSFRKEIGLQLSIEDLVENIRLAHGLQISLDYFLPYETRLDDKLKMTVFRIVQEQLNNILKHAAAAQARISVRQRGSSLILLIADDGRGFDVGTKRRGIGISNIISRAEIFNGIVELDSAPGEGCRMLVTFKAIPELTRPVFNQKGR